MTRITQQDVNVQIDGINDILTEINAEYRLKLNGRAGYSVIERVDAKNQYRILTDPLIGGTMRECYSFAAALLRGMWMARGEY